MLPKKEENPSSASEDQNVMHDAVNAEMLDDRRVQKLQVSPRML